MQREADADGFPKSIHTLSRNIANVHNAPVAVTKWQNYPEQLYVEHKSRSLFKNLFCPSTGSINCKPLDHFLFYCRPSRASLNQALAFAGVMDGRASVMA
jgi:hypothetical protein